VRPLALQVDELQPLGLVTELGVHAGLQQCGVLNMQLKWPNDLLFNKKKLGGILLEFKQNAGRNYIVFGVGINMELPASVLQEIDQPATYLTTVLNAPVDKSRVLNCVVSNLLTYLQKFEQTAFAGFQEQWNALDCYVNQDIVLQVGEKSKIGKSVGVNEQGALLLQTAMGLEVISSGEIFPSLRPVSGEDVS